jgi:hypothetical protein
MKIMMVVALCVGLVAVPVLAQDSGTGSGGFWNDLKSVIEKLVPVKKSVETTAVGGVRGAKDTDADGLYWKSEERKIQVDEVELGAFKQALELVAAGKRAEAQAGFEQFLVAYPASGLAEDARKAIDALKAGQ